METTRPPPARINRPQVDTLPNPVPFLPRQDTIHLNQEHIPPEQDTHPRLEDTHPRLADTHLKPVAATQLPREEGTRHRQEVTPPPSPGTTPTCPLQQVDGAANLALELLEEECLRVTPGSQRQDSSPCQGTQVPQCQTRQCQGTEEALRLDQHFRSALLSIRVTAVP